MTDRAAADGAVSRAVAASVLVAVDEGAWLSTALDRELRKRRPSRRDAAAATRLAYATGRNTRLCDALVAPHSRRPPDRLDPAVRAVLRVGACELAVLGTPPHAAVHAAVAATRRVGAGAAAGLVNAVLRRVASGPSPDAVTDDPAVRWSQQDWVVDQLVRRCGEETAASVLEAFNTEPPVALRVDVGTPEDCVAELAAQGFAAEVVALRCPDGRAVPSVAVRGAGDPAKLDCVVQSRAVVQDPSSTLAGMLLTPAAGEIVVDLAAGPGGKTLQLAAGGADVVAVEPVASRARAVAGRVAARRAAGPAVPARVSVVVADGRRPPLPDAVADAVLLDAPCSGLGTLGRRPDLRSRVRPDDVVALAALQRALLDAALRCVRPGGTVVYGVCTFTEDETDAVVAAAVGSGAAATVGPPVQIWPRPGLPVNAFWAQVLRRTG